MVCTYNIKNISKCQKDDLMCNDLSYFDLSGSFLDTNKGSHNLTKICILIL